MNCMIRSELFFPKTPRLVAFIGLILLELEFRKLRI